MKPIHKIHQWYECKEELYREQSDSYDRATVEECRRWLSRLIESTADINNKPWPEEEKKRYRNMFIDLAMYYITGERYANKEETIQDIIEDRQRRADCLETATPPRGVNCLICRTEMTEADRTSMGLDDEKILFTYSCSTCKRHRAFCEDGEEYLVKRPKCEDCHQPLKEVSSWEKDILTVTQTCSACGKITTEVHDYTFTPTPDPVIDENYEADRARFCLSKEKGQEYLASRSRMEHSAYFANKDIEEEEKRTQEKLKEIEKLTLQQIEKKLDLILEPNNYSNLIFGKAQIERDIRVGFQIQDKLTRSDDESRLNLQKMIIKTLKGTNWKLMTGGVKYRLGILTGRLRGFDNEKDLLELAKHM
ncbi:MAG: hypothetical protein WC805_01270 [Patescibacteria group bacterium]|jgi:hypothetical protein